jgi:hypothetical protein
MVTMFAARRVRILAAETTLFVETTETTVSSRPDSRRLSRTGLMTIADAPTHRASGTDGIQRGQQPKEHFEKKAIREHDTRAAGQEP